MTFLESRMYFYYFSAEKDKIDFSNGVDLIRLHIEWPQ